MSRSLTSKELNGLLQRQLWEDQLDLLGQLLSGELVLQDDSGEEDRLATKIATILTEVRSTGTLNYPAANGLPLTIVKDHWIATRMSGHLELYLPKLNELKGWSSMFLVNTHLLRTVMVGLDSLQSSLYLLSSSFPVSQNTFLDSAYLRFIIDTDPDLDWFKLSLTEQIELLTKAAIQRERRQVNSLLDLNLRERYQFTHSPLALPEIDSDQVGVVPAGKRGTGDSHSWFPVLPKFLTTNVKVRGWEFLVVPE